jgi:glycosyltransferase involved in cell wall biosynthesis
MKMEKVLVATPLRNEEQNLPRFFSLLESLDYPTELLSLAFLEGDSTDNTYEKLLEWKNSHPSLKIWLKKLDLGMEKTKFERLAISRNTIVEEALKDEDYVFWLEGDVETLPTETLKSLIDDNRDIVTALLVFDEPPLRSRYFLGKTDRPYIKDIPEGLVQVGWVGGVFLVKRRVCEAQVKCDVRKDLGETVSFCLNAKEHGFSCYVDTRIKVKHKP